VNNMDLVCRTTVSRFGNSRAVIIPKNISDFPVKSKIDLFKTADGILIRPVIEWSADKQIEAVDALLSYVSSPENEPLPDDFEKKYLTDDNADDLDFSETVDDR